MLKISKYQAFSIADPIIGASLITVEESQNHARKIQITKDHIAMNPILLNLKQHNSLLTQAPVS